MQLWLIYSMCYAVVINFHCRSNSNTSRQWKVSVTVMSFYVITGFDFESCGNSMLILSGLRMRSFSFFLLMNETLARRVYSAPFNVVFCSFLFFSFVTMEKEKKNRFECIIWLFFLIRFVSSSSTSFVIRLLFFFFACVFLILFIN